MRIIILFLILSFNITSCDMLIRSASQKAVETVESITEEEPEPPKKKKEGEIKSYYESGKLKAVVNYHNGMKDGKAITYYENGNVKISMFYKNGKKEGPSKYYYENGKIYRESEYVNDELEGIRKIYNNGKLSAEVPYKNGYTGIGLKEYFFSGKLKTEYPDLEFEEVDTRKENHTYSVYIKFTKSHPKDMFYIGDLEDGLYLHDDLYPMICNDGVGKLPLDIAPDVVGAKIFNFIAVHHTKQGNSYVVKHDYMVDIE